MIIEHLHKLISPTIDWNYDSSGNLLGKTDLETAKNIPKGNLTQFYDRFKLEFEADKGIMTGLSLILAGTGLLFTAQSIASTSSALISGDPALYGKAAQSGLMSLMTYAFFWPMIYSTFDLPRLVKKTVENRLQENI